MKKRILSILLVFAMLIGVMPLAGITASAWGVVCEIEGVGQFTSLQAAINACPGTAESPAEESTTIHFVYSELEDDGITVGYGKNIIFDMDENNIQLSPRETALINYGTLKIQNGYIFNGAYGTPVLNSIINYGKLSLENTEICSQAGEETTSNTAIKNVATAEMTPELYLKNSTVTAWGGLSATTFVSVEGDTVVINGGSYDAWPSDEDTGSYCLLNAGGNVTLLRGLFYGPITVNGGSVDVYSGYFTEDISEIDGVTITDNYECVVNMEEETCEEYGYAVIRPEVAYKVNLEIAGDIALNTKVENIPFDEVENYRILAYIDGAETGTELELTAAGYEAVAATVRFPAAEMTTPVKLEVYNGATLVKTIDTSIKNVAETYIELYRGTENTVYATIAASMLVYGSKAQQYFNVRTDNLADSNKTVLGDYPMMFMIDSPDPEAACVVTDNNNGAKILGSSMVLLENMDIKVYIEAKNDISGYTADVNGTSAEIVHANDNFYYVRVSELTPEDLTGIFTVSFTNTATSVTSSYNFDFLGYCVGCIKSNDAKLSALGDALFDYVFYSAMYAYSLHN